MTARRSTALAVALRVLMGSAGAPLTVVAHQAHAHAPLAGVPREILERPAPLRQGIGVANERVTTSSERAQAYYNQGLAYLHSYVWIEAARSFNAALRLDPNLAMASMGLSYALGETRPIEEARQASDKARSLAAAASEREQVRIDVRATEVQALAHPGDAALGLAYRARLDAALAKHPKNVELLLLRGHAADPSRDAPGMGGGSDALRFYEKALAEAPDYFAVHHYLSHAYENVNRVDRALVHGKAFARLAWAVPHAHHMYGHVLRRADRMKDATTQFKKADELELAYLAAEQIPPEYDWHYHHNLDLLGTSYQYLGQMKAAEPVLRRSFGLPSIQLSQELNEKEWPMFLLARGRAMDALTAVQDLMERPAPLVQAIGHVLASRVMMALKRMPAAAEEGNAGLHQMRAIGAAGGTLLPDFELSQGEYLLRNGQTDQGRAMLRDAVAKLRAQLGPDAWVLTLFTLEGVARVAREVGDWTLAGEMADEMRRHDASYAGTQYAVGLAAEQRGDRAAARAAFADAVRRWADADPDLPELKDARQRLAKIAG